MRKSTKFTRHVAYSFTPSSDALPSNRVDIGSANDRGGELISNTELTTDGNTTNIVLLGFITAPIQHTTRPLRGKALSEYLAPLQARGFTQIQKDAIVGGLLGDGTLQYSTKHFPFYKFDQKAANREYVNLIYSIFNEYVGTPPTLPRKKQGRIHSYWFRTFSLPQLNFYARQFYEIDVLGNRKKVVPKLINRWLNPQSLAFWFMDDGSKATNGAYTLNTQGFIRPDVVRLQQALGSVFNIQSNIQHDASNLEKNSVPYYILYIPVSHAAKFKAIVEPYMLNLMKYKLH